MFARGQSSPFSDAFTASAIVAISKKYRDACHWYQLESAPSRR